MVQALHARERLAAVNALEHRHLRTPDDVRVDRIDSEGRIIPGALTKVLLAVDALPVLAAVVRAVEATLIGFDECVHAAVLRGRNRNSNFPPDPFGKTLPPVLFGCLLVGEV